MFLAFPAVLLEPSFSPKVADGLSLQWKREDGASVCLQSTVTC